VNRKTQISYTFESASAGPLDVRVQALTRAVNWVGSAGKR